MKKKYSFASPKPSTLADFLASEIVDWQELSTYVTIKGKQKKIVRGIPTDKFWSKWKCKPWRETFKHWQVTVSAFQPDADAGVVRMAPKKLRQWDVILWCDKTLDQVSQVFDLQEFEQQNTADCPF